MSMQPNRSVDCRKFSLSASVAEMANDTDEYETNVRKGIEVIQSMIDISADRLEALRTQCATSAELTQLEIRTLETKLVKMFSELLITQAKLAERLPKSFISTGAELKQWLRVVGLSQESSNAVMQRVNTLEILLGKNDGELQSMLNHNVNVNKEEVRRFLRAIFNLKRCREAITVGTIEPNELFWDSWDRHNVQHVSIGASPRSGRITPRYQQLHHHSRLMSIPQPNFNMQIVDITIKDRFNALDASEKAIHLISPEDTSTSTSTLTPSSSPENSPSIMNMKNRRGAKNSTPPARKKHQTVLSLNQTQPTNSVQYQYNYQQQFTPPMATTTNYAQTNHLHNVDAMPKSRSQESQWGHGHDGPNNKNSTEITTAMTSMASVPLCFTENNSYLSNTTVTLTAPAHNTIANLPTPRSRLHTEPSPEIFNDIGDSTPIVNRGMGHTIAHRFAKKFNVMYTCDLCNKQMFFGLKCKECKYRCHKDCETNVPSSCGLPQAFIDEFKKTLPSDVFLSNASSPNMVKSGGVGFLSSGRRDRHRSQAFTTQYVGAPDSSSAGSSCNSSSPSSPALIPLHTPAASKQTQFHFPDLALNKRPSIQYEVIEESKEIQTSKYNSSQSSNQNRSIVLRTQSSGLTETTCSNGSDKTEKTVSLSGSISASTDSVRSDSTDERGGHGNWPRQNSLSLKEWDIPFEDLKLLEEIGRGRFGSVHRGLWHGDVAVKIFKEGYIDDEGALAAFKLEVATFKKTRHENLVLFMGFCMKPQAMVTSLCKGNTLYTHIHSRRDKFNLYRAILVAQQISQGMGYLHAKEIIHKDLKTKNIFLENGKVVITDFGLFSTTKMKYTAAGLFIEENCLCYLAPELMRQLRAIRSAQENLPFSKASDVYAFGTIWYELLCGEFPFKGQSIESTIYQIGRGMKYTLANVQASRDVKDILMLCSAYQADDRPDFAKLLALVERLPKKRLARSPSHPMQLSRSAESVF